MKKAISLVLILVVILGSIGLVACGGGETGTTPTPSNGGTTPTPSPTPPPSGLNWTDMPVYSGVVTQVQKGSWAIPPEEGEWTKVEWRYYETGDSVSQVAAFYRAQMPGNGWQEVAWMEMQEMSWGLYNKNDEKDGAMIWVGSDEGKTFIALMRATR